MLHAQLRCASLSNTMWQLLFELFHLVHLVAEGGAAGVHGTVHRGTGRHKVSVWLLVAWYIVVGVVWTMKESRHEPSVGPHGTPVSPAGTFTMHIVLLAANAMVLLWCSTQIAVGPKPMGEMTFTKVCEQPRGVLAADVYIVVTLARAGAGGCSPRSVVLHQPRVGRSFQRPWPVPLASVG